MKEYESGPNKNRAIKNSGVAEEAPIVDTGKSDDFLYICSTCSTVTYAPVQDCPACGDDDDPLKLALVKE